MTSTIQRRTRRWRRVDVAGSGPRAKRVLELSLRESLRLKHNSIGLEHVLLGIAKENEGGAIAVLRTVGIDGDAVRAAALQRLEDLHGGD